MRVYLFKELKPAGVPFTRKHVTTLEQRGEFPAHFNLTDYTVAWVADEVDAWVAERVRAHRANPKTTRRHKVTPRAPAKRNTGDDRPGPPAVA